jgi:hypothetical protein
MKTTSLLLLSILLAFSSYSAPSSAHRTRLTTGGETLTSNKGVVFNGSDKLVSPDSFHPPVEITIIAKTDSTNLRMGYAADQVIFNWEENMDQLRVDGGPAGNRQADGAGRIPKDKFVMIKWQVTPEHQAIYVDGKLRFEHSGNYSQIDKPFSIFPASGSTVTVKSISISKQ